MTLKGAGKKGAIVYNIYSAFYACFPFEQWPRRGEYKVNRQISLRSSSEHRERINDPERAILIAGDMKANSIFSFIYNSEIHFAFFFP